MAFGFYPGMAVLMANPTGRRAALRRRRPIRLASAAAMLRPVVLR